MTVHTLISELAARGVHLWAEADDKLKLDAPRGLLSEADKARIAEQKADILKILAPPPYLNAQGDLLVPTTTMKRYRYWQGGQSIWATLAELHAPLATWRKYAALRDDLLTESHARRCGGKVEQADGFAYCVECGSYIEELPQEAAPEWVM